MSKKKSVAVAILDGKIVAVHDDPTVVEEFVSDNDNMDILYDYPYKKIKRINNFPDLYLVQVGNYYVPSGLSRVAESQLRDISEDYRKSKMTLLAVLETEDISSSEKECVEKTIEVLEKLLCRLEGEVPPYHDLEEIKSLDETYRGIIGKY